MRIIQLTVHVLADIIRCVQKAVTHTRRLPQSNLWIKWAISILCKLQAMNLLDTNKRNRVHRPTSLTPFLSYTRQATHIAHVVRVQRRFVMFRISKVLLYQSPFHFALHLTTRLTGAKASVSTAFSFWNIGTSYRCVLCVWVSNECVVYACTTYVYTYIVHRGSCVPSTHSSNHNLLNLLRVCVCVCGNVRTTIRGVSNFQTISCLRIIPIAIYYTWNKKMGRMKRARETCCSTSTKTCVYAIR